jgi:hypothetical protein
MPVLPLPAAHADGLVPLLPQRVTNSNLYSLETASWYPEENIMASKMLKEKVEN